MIPQWIIEQKRDGEELSREELSFFIEGYTNETIPDYQMAAMAMAIYFKGMTLDETATLTDLMMNSGDLVDTSSIDLPKVDKHSTGGVGDKVSLLLAPLVACCDAAVPMISGRGLGITGGTLDKMESIPGYRVGLSDSEFLSVLKACGCSMIGQTGQLAPADKKLYALRDVTGTVPSIPLITGSIMSKKLAEGIDGLVMDVKWGKGAFMKTYEDAQELARTIVEVGTRMNKGMAALITDMNQPLGWSAGNSVEVIESMDALQGKGAPDLMEVTLALCAHMLVLVNVEQDIETARAKLQKQIDSGAAFEKFKHMVQLHGGDPKALDNYSLLPKASESEVYTAPQDGYVAQVSAEQVGRAVVLMGGGRSKTDDAVDHGVGITDIVKVGQQVSKGDPLLTIHANSADKLAGAKELIDKAFAFSDSPVTAEDLIKEVILPEKKS